MPHLNQLLIYSVRSSTKTCCFPQHRGMPLPLPISLAYQRQKAQTAGTSSRWCRNSSFKPAGGSHPRYSLRGLLGFTGYRTGWKREMINPQGVLQWNFLTEAPGWWQDLGERGLCLGRLWNHMHGVWRGSVQQVRHFLCLLHFYIILGKTASRAAQQLRCLCPSPTQELKIH